MSRLKRDPTFLFEDDRKATGERRTRLQSTFEKKSLKAKHAPLNKKRALFNKGKWKEGLKMQAGPVS